jgi:hypothetical protein
MYHDPKRDLTIVAYASLNLSPKQSSDGGNRAVPGLRNGATGKRAQKFVLRPPASR